VAGNFIKFFGAHANKATKTLPPEMLFLGAISGWRRCCIAIK
jgi:hypothetical protein